MKLLFIFVKNMPVFQPGHDIIYDENHEVKCDKAAKLFVTVTCITIIDMVFVIGCAFVYLKEYYTVVKDTYDSATNSYTIKQPFVLLYLWQSICALLILLWIVFFVIWLLVNTMC